MTTHRRLREATHPDHEAVDAAFAAFDLADRASYTRFLSAHAAALGAVEPAAAPDDGRLPLLAADLATLGGTLPPPLPFGAPAGDAARWGMRYTLEGSRLGGAMLARRVPADLPSAYLGARQPSGAWRAFTAALDEAVTGEPAIAEATEAARAVFDLFRRAAGTELGEVNADH